MTMRDAEEHDGRVPTRIGMLPIVQGKKNRMARQRQTLRTSTSVPFIPLRMRQSLLAAWQADNVADSSSLTLVPGAEYPPIGGRSHDKPTSEETFSALAVGRLADVSQNAFRPPGNAETNGTFSTWCIPITTLRRGLGRVLRICNDRPFRPFHLQTGCQNATLYQLPSFTRVSASSARLRWQ
ncbi:hypothetical protein BCR34DRAFT_149377 [Clohesyomyces aquaticus]|uniref:Uncharacterized protein n=1 Tax=Clohesyomyces aquaticus TaxID=1231657 RepID=A0A1Y1YLR6_9PLEO|nr:hypothetical protein BCR34DRAFT_149377 [Clohesyomyces aquaticus]